MLCSKAEKPEEEEGDSISALERSLESLNVRKMENNNDSDVGHAVVHQKDSLFSRGPLARMSSLEDVIEEDQQGGGGLDMSPLKGRISRSPQRRLEDNHSSLYGAHSGICRLRNRRRSDPGRISVSPLRHMTRIKLEGQIAEDGDYENRPVSAPVTVRMRQVPVRRSSSFDPTEIDEAMPLTLGIHSRSRSPHAQVTPRLRTQRSHSLPGIDLEYGEALGALAMRQMSLEPALPVRPQSLGSGKPRRRSVSLETASPPLEAIVEENISNVKVSRRFSSPNVHSLFN